MHGKNGTMHMIPRKIVMTQITIIYQKHSALITPIDQILGQLLSGGLVEFWASHYFSSIYLAEEEKEKPPAPLNLQNMLASFEILILGYIFSLIVFIGERFHFHKFLKKVTALKMYK
jgi:hypothetical protein